MKKAELTNGRAAMFGCAVVFLAAVSTKTSLLASLQLLDLKTLWLSIGVYAS